MKIGKKWNKFEKSTDNDGYISILNIIKLGQNNIEVCLNNSKTNTFLNYNQTYNVRSNITVTDGINYSYEITFKKK